MIPKIRLRGYTEHSNVSILSSQGGSQGPVFKVTIRLPQHVLEELEEETELFNYDLEPPRTPKIRPKPSIASHEDDEDTIFARRTTPKIHPSSHEDEDDVNYKELLRLDQELNKVLQQPIKKEPASQKEKYHGYRPIPKNIIPLIEKELARLNPDDSDELGIIDKIVFSLKDPLAASKIRLPVKSSKCIHFECFDFENFCVFNKIPKGIQNLLKKDIAKRNYQKLAFEKRRGLRQTTRNQNQDSDVVKIILSPKSFHQNAPKYKCPLCDRQFALHELIVDDSYNYFVRNTPQETERIEILDMKQYKIVDEMRSKSVTADEEVIVLSSDEDDMVPTYPRLSTTPAAETTFEDSENELFNDGLDEELLNLGSNDNAYFKGSGSWEDPLTLD
ncbi:uncharacterized protein CANTADRAFT_24147 [Suhomyces tanzawaensis NRRL Y-17324]|uniref:Uncharacterized protein n=1 Tax=Suhomyces tanzawaensis NRRL Y-17324 TaxID=984487 RepID=A0A1E4SBN7_9ASCO|nr:uncharacterized protein CANTADRAFT_24147 [Suhomyces tanzawaensis NRRL Y-17324]ODV76888.1 hypothetical protein CANTADRAFT_24147 [Suhomyces tanzawaensis NRRL Y-17324]